MLKGIAVQADRLNGGHNLSLTLNDVCGMAEFGLALGCQIHKAVKVNTGKLFTPFLFVAIDIRTDFCDATNCLTPCINKRMLRDWFSSAC